MLDFIRGKKESLPSFEWMKAHFADYPECKTLFVVEFFFNAIYDFFLKYGSE